MSQHSTGDSEEYRDHISTVDKEGKRVWIYPKKPSGRYYKARMYVSWLLLIILFLGPFLRIHGHPVFLLNFPERQFYLFGIGFWPQDLHLFGLALITLIVFIILFTAIFGRVFCGWVCPQTIFMEMVFRKIEYWIEGDARDQRRLNQAPWTVNKFFKKFTKHGIFYGIAFLIGNVFLAYIIGSEQLIHIVTSPPTEHLGGLTAMIIFSFVFYWVFAWFREQVCVMVCPYGRLQGVLLDQNSIVVHYDFNRGEPRGKRRRTESSSLGDCIDCYQCVDVCPTGIDIRYGTQLECVNCTACMDACDTIMDRIKRPRGLIRYASYNSLLQGTRSLFNSRTIGYSAVLVMLVGILSFLLATRVSVETTILRTPGVLFQEMDNGDIRNLYNVTVLNKSTEPMPVSLRLLEPEEGSLIMVGDLSNIGPEELGSSAFFLELPDSLFSTRRIPVKIGVFSAGNLLEEKTSTFIGPGR